jgi:hypothetical protein
MPLTRSTLLALCSTILIASAAACLEGLGGLTGGETDVGEGGPLDAGANDSASPTSDGGGGSDASGGQDGSLDGTGPSSDSGGGDAPSWSPSCPADLPAIGTQCTHLSLQCEYGSAWWSISCDSVVQCVQGTWSVYDPSSEACTGQPGTPPGCPGSYSLVVQGGACATHGLACGYAQGECWCQVPQGSNQLDAGADWICLPGPNCPVPRPRVGAACSGDPTGGSTSPCSYETCTYAEICQNGVWQAEQEGCAVAGIPSASH